MAKVLRGLLLIVGILAMLMGLLWVGQGLGIIMWPASSFMLAERVWALYGALLALFGAILLRIGLRRVP